MDLATSEQRKQQVLIRHLSYFVTLASEGHYARAAKVCCVTQPTITMAVRKLEEELQTALVIRSHRFVGLTADGREVLEWGRRILADYASLQEGLSGAHQGLTGRLRLGAVPTALPAMPLMTSRFRTDHPEVEIDILSMTSRQIEEELGALTIDAAMTYLDNEPLDRVRTMPLYRERYIFVTHRGHRYADRSTITWAEVANERLCLLRSDMQNRRIINSIAASVDVEIEAKIVSNSLLVFFSHVAQGGWSSIVAHTLSLSMGRSSELVAIDIVDPAESRSIGLVIPTRDPLSPVTAALAKLVRTIDFEQALSLQRG